jgi:hypothetical protein
LDSKSWLVAKPKRSLFFSSFPFSFWKGGWSTVCIHLKHHLVFFSFFLSSKERGFLMSLLSSCISSFPKCEKGEAELSTYWYLHLLLRGLFGTIFNSEIVKFGLGDGDLV